MAFARGDLTVCFRCGRYMSRRTFRRHSHFACFNPNGQPSLLSPPLGAPPYLPEIPTFSSPTPTISPPPTPPSTPPTQPASPVPFDELAPSSTPPTEPASPVPIDELVDELADDLADEHISDYSTDSSDYMTTQYASSETIDSSSTESSDSDVEMEDLTGVSETSGISEFTDTFTDAGMHDMAYWDGSSSLGDTNSEGYESDDDSRSDSGWSHVSVPFVDIPDPDPVAPPQPVPAAQVQFVMCPICYTWGTQRRAREHAYLGCNHEMRVAYWEDPQFRRRYWSYFENGYDRDPEF
ncbi:hypothetical protein FRC12_015510 [Ceratobasidium sp. 428]|nr:hypothetical protein FRC12_015510 [Ceratobasidium sp. 428]